MVVVSSVPELVPFFVNLVLVPLRREEGGGCNSLVWSGCLVISKWLAR